METGVAPSAGASTLRFLAIVQVFVEDLRSHAQHEIGGQAYAHRAEAPGT
jgi:hypothetical protein